MDNQSFTYGIDISKDQGKEISSLAPGSDNLSFIICKATEGITYTDPDFATNWAGIPKKGFIRGAYHFYRCNDDPSKQADNFLNAVGPFSNQDLPPVIDIEEMGVNGCPDIMSVQQSIQALLSVIESKTGRKPIIYTDINTARKYINNDEFAAYPLYIAEYSVAAPSVADTVWQENGWAFWQKGQTTLAGISNDYDVFNGDLGTLQSFIANH